MMILYKAKTRLLSWYGFQWNCVRLLQTGLSNQGSMCCAHHQLGFGQLHFVTYVFQLGCIPNWGQPVFQWGFYELGPYGFSLQVQVCFCYQAELDFFIWLFCQLAPAGLQSGQLSFSVGVFLTYGTHKDHFHITSIALIQCPTASLYLLLCKIMILSYIA